MAESSPPTHRDYVRHEYHQPPDRPGSASFTSHVDWSQTQDAFFPRGTASPAPSAYSNTTISAPAGTIAAYASSQHGHFEASFSPHLTTFSDAGDYRVGLFANSITSPALSACTLDTTASSLNSSVASYASSVQSSTFAMDSFTHPLGGHTAGFNHSSSNARPPPLAYSDCLGNQVGPSSGTFHSCTRPDLPVNTTLGLEASSGFPSNNITAGPAPLTSSWTGHGQLAANMGTSSALQHAHSGPSPTYSQGEALFPGPGHYNYTGDYGSCDSMPTNNVNTTYSPALQSYLSGAEPYSSYDSHDSYTATYHRDNRFDAYLGVPGQSTAMHPGFIHGSQVNSYGIDVAPSPTALARDAMATIGSMGLGPYSGQEPEGYSA